MVEGCGSKEYAKVKKFAYGDPEGFQALIDLLVRVTADYLNAQIEAGAQAVMIFDSLSSGDAMAIRALVS